MIIYCKVIDRMVLSVLEIIREKRAIDTIFCGVIKYITPRNIYFYSSQTMCRQLKKTKISKFL